MTLIDLPCTTGTPAGTTVPGSGITGATATAPDIDTAIDTAIDTGIDTAIDTGVDTEVDTGVGTEIVTGPAPAIDTGIDTEVDTEVDTGVDTEIVTGPAPAIDTGIDTGPDEPVGSSFARCADGNGTLTHLFFSDDEFDIARAKAICAKCGLAPHCLAGALERVEPYGVWGGQLLVDGEIVLVKRGRGRPPKTPRPALVVDEVPLPPHLVA